VGQLFVQGEPELQPPADLPTEGTHPILGVSRGCTLEGKKSQQCVLGDREAGV